MTQRACCVPYRQTKHDVDGPAKSQLTCMSSIPLWLQ